MKTNLKNYLPTILSFQSSIVEYESGKKDVLKIAKSVCIDEQNELVYHYDLTEYSLRAVFTFCKNFIQVKVIATPKGKIKDKITVTSIKAFVKLNQDAIVWKRKFTDTGFCSRKKLDKTGVSEDFIAFYEQENANDGLLFSAKMDAKFYSNLSYLQKNTGIEISINTYIPKSYDGLIESQTWSIRYGDDIYSLLEKEMNVYPKSDQFEKPMGWSTWDYYFTDANEDDVKANVDFIYNDPTLKEKIEYIALDDGWQQREGDWRSGIRYPSGLNSLCKYIKEKGFKAGIWIAPTRLHFLCGTVMRRNDFLVRNDLGDPIMDEDMYVLDPTHPDGEKFLRETFTYIRECGFEFVKLDFVSNLLKVERFYDKSSGPYDALKKLFKLARECLGDNCHIMGCSLPYLIGTGVANSRRSGLDIHNTYKHLKKCFEIACYQLPSNERVHRLDVDYLVVRGKETSEDEKTNVLNPNKYLYANNPTDKFRWRDGEDFSFVEAKTWCAVMLTTGSSIFLGDNLTKLNEKGLNLIKRTLNYADFHSAKPVISSCEGAPEVWQKENLLTVFNFGEIEKSYTVNAQNGEYQDIFTDDVYLVKDNLLTIKLGAHDCICLKNK